MKKQFERLHAARVGEGEGGFTLIELLIVIVILGVLAAVVVFSVGGLTSTGQKAACKADVEGIQTAVESFRAQNGRYPDDLDEVDDGVFISDDLGPAGTMTKASGAGGGAYTVTYNPLGTPKVTVAPDCDSLT